MESSSFSRCACENSCASYEKDPSLFGSKTRLVTLILGAYALSLTIIVVIFHCLTDMGFFLTKIMTNKRLSRNDLTMSDAIKSIAMIYVRYHVFPLRLTAIQLS